MIPAGQLRRTPDDMAATCNLEVNREVNCEKATDRACGRFTSKEANQPATEGMQAASSYM